MSESFQRIPVVLHTGSEPVVRETYGFTSHGIVLEGQLLCPPGQRPSGTVFVFLHPTGSLSVLPMPMALASAGHHVLCASSRYPRNDTALIMEKVVLDLGSWVSWARSTGYEKVVLVGWSGGGSLSLLYQAEALDPSITHTPAGDPVDVVGAGLTPADAIIFIAAHLSRAETLTEWMDPSVLDELDPSRRDQHLDIYAPDAPRRPPYPADFVAEFRAAQQARNRRITAWALTRLGRLRADGGPELEQPFLVHRTMCDLRWLDPTIDPNDRRAGWCYLGDPRTANVGPVGLARYTTLRSWLSQWSLDHSVAGGARNAARIGTTPVLQIVNSADDAVPATHNPTVRAALGTQDATYHEIPGATHYYVDQPELLAQCIGLIEDWLEEHGPIDSPLQESLYRRNRFC